MLASCKHPWHTWGNINFAFLLQVHAATLPWIRCSWQIVIKLGRPCRVCRIRITIQGKGIPPPIFPLLTDCFCTSVTQPRFGGFLSNFPSLDDLPYCWCNEYTVDGQKVPTEGDYVFQKCLVSRNLSKVFLSETEVFIKNKTFEAEDLAVNDWCLKL